MAPLGRIDAEFFLRLARCAIAVRENTTPHPDLSPEVFPHILFIFAFRFLFAYDMLRHVAGYNWFSDVKRRLGNPQMHR